MKRPLIVYLLILGVLIAVGLIAIRKAEGRCPCESCVWSNTIGGVTYVYKSASVVLSGPDYLPCEDIPDADCVPRPQVFQLPSHRFPAIPEDDLSSYCGFWRYTECGSYSNEFGEYLGNYAVHWGIYPNGETGGLILDIFNYWPVFWHTFYGFSSGINSNHQAFFTNVWGACIGETNNPDFATVTFSP